MRPTTLIFTLVLVLVGAAFLWSRRQAPAPVVPTGELPAAAAPGNPPAPPPVEPAPSAAAPAAAPALPDGNNPAAPGPRAEAPGAPPPAAPAKPVHPSDPAAAGERRLGGGKGELFDPLNSGLRQQR